MENIEEEMTSQYEKSSQRLKSNRLEVEDVGSGVIGASKVDARPNARAGGEAEDGLGGGRGSHGDQGKEISTRLRDFAGGPPHSNPIMSDLAEIEESLASSSRAMSTYMKQGTSGAVGSKVEPREAYQKIRERMLELEIEREEQQKAMELLKEIRSREKEDLS